MIVLDTQLAEYFAAHREQHLAELADFLTIPSISALSEHKEDVQRAAQWMAAALSKAGLEHVQILPTAGHPVVYADYIKAPGRPTVLVYGHYDVQPVDPVSLWETPPFEPTIRDGRLFARGASDDKGQVFMHVKAIEALLEQGLDLPVNIKFCVEGEEEVGSRNLPAFVEAHQDLLAADVLLISDTTILGPGQPAICYGLRGLCGLEVHLRAAKSDLHSGLFGGAVPNALHALVELLATLHDKTGRVAVPGFYEDVQPLSVEERTALNALPHDDAAFRASLGLKELVGEPGYGTQERIMARPTLELNGVYGGFQGEGSKTVIPAEAHAKITCRLVNDQEPEKVTRLIEDHLRRHAPTGVTLTVNSREGGRPFVTRFDSPAIAAAAKAYEAGFGVAPYYMRMGGSIPIVETFGRLLQIPVVMMGFALPEENFHAPNEYFTLENFDKGLLTLAHYYSHLASV